MKLVLFAILTIVIICCESNPYNCSLDNSILTRNDSIMQLPDYKAGLTPLLLKHKEPELETLGIKAYRLLIIYDYSESRDTWVYRFEKNEDGGLLTLKKTYTEGHKKRFLSFSDTTIYRQLSAEKWNEIENTFDSNCFWTLPIAIDRRGIHGRQCILEAFDPDSQNPVDKEYFAAGRWSPEKDTEFRKICDFIESVEPREEW